MHAGLKLETGVALGGRYRLDAVIGSGAGEAWRAFDQRLNRPVVVRLLPGDPAVARPTAEAAAALRHPGVTAILDIAQHESVLFLVTELLEGQDLAAALTTQPGGLPVAHLPAVAVQVSGALAAAHEQGVVHGGLKPGDLFVMPDGQLKVCDFGVLRPAGTARYQAPEQSQDSPADQRTDLYAFGCVLFELITGRRPEGGPPVPIRSLRPDAPEYLERLLLDLQAVDPAARPPAAAVHDFLRAKGADYHDLAMPAVAPTVMETSAPTLVATAPAPPARGSRRQFVLGAISGVVAAALVGGGVFAGVHAASSPAKKHHARTVARRPVAPAPVGPIQGPAAPGAMTPTSPPLVAGWKPAWSTAHGIIYEVPANWKVQAPDTFIGEADATGNVALGSSGAADISTSTVGASTRLCTLVQSGVGSGRGLGVGSPSDTGLTGSLEVQAAQTAVDWADFSFTNAAGTLPGVKLGNNQDVTIDGQAAAIVTATATEKPTTLRHKRDWCHPPSGVVDAVAMQSRSGSYITFYVMSDEGIPGGLSQAVMRQIINTIRPLG